MKSVKYYYHLVSYLQYPFVVIAACYLFYFAMKMSIAVGQGISGVQSEAWIMRCQRFRSVCWYLVLAIGVASEMFENHRWDKNQEKG